MEYGIGLPNYGLKPTLDWLNRVARAAEDLGYASIWTTDHVMTPHATSDPYGRIFESLVTLGYLAAQTRQVKLGTSILVLPQRNTILAAKQLATIDYLSGGRLICGVGAGWMDGEYKSLGADFHRRGRILDEQMAAMRELWSNADPRFAGKFTSFDDGVFEPKPVQSGGIPIWIGGQSDAALGRVARLGDGWHPNGLPPEVYGAAVKGIREAAGQRGSAITMSMRLSIDLDSSKAMGFVLPNGAPRLRLTGSVDDIRAMLDQLEEAGLQHPALYFPQEDVNSLVMQMETFARAIRL